MHVFTLVTRFSAVAELIDILQAQYEFTERTLRELSRDSDDVTMASTYTVTQDMDLDEPRDSAESSLVLVNSLKDQLCDIADVLLKAFVERKGFLELTSTTAQQQRELRALEERYHDVRPKVIKPLVPIGRTESAFQLAEQFGDFKSLVELSSGLAQAPSRARIQYYIGKFREEFAYVLFAWYIEKGAWLV
ncbi:hypothetical protein BC936DRAFT_141655 [Jimgerdemannia flammicorona]|uniref:Uncharacterized protein n=1 Tax=Jimgerdemannia flammicorona TaxID=994334 RepID=A0A433A1V4_9FUNG|nr:hypothetical protein BC936DRAFT_141655 [Jimgerdemannia flammicorona]